MRMLLIPLLLLAVASPAFADDLTGKSVTVKVDGLKLGRKLDNGLIRDGDALSAKKSYVVKADDGTFLELAGGFVFKSDVEVVAMAEFPKKFVKDADGETPKDRWAFGTKVLPTKSSDKIQFGDWIDDKQEYFKLSGIMPMEVRKDNGDGWVRIHDHYREGWVQKEDLVSKEDAPIFWDKAVKADPKDTFALYMRGTGWRQKGELDNALADYNECIRLDPADYSNYNARGTVWHDKKDFDKAIADYTEAIRLEPDSALAHNNRGNSWSDKKDYDKAIADYTEAIRLDPKDVYAFNGRGYAWMNKKDYDKAIADYTEAIQVDPKNLFAYNKRGYNYKSKKLYDKAIQDFTEGMRLDPNNHNIIDSNAEFYATCPDAKYRDGKKAVELAKLAIAKAGKDVTRAYFRTLAAAYAEVGDFELAVTEQRKVLDDKQIDATDKKVQEARLALYRAKKPYRDE